MNQQKQYPYMDSHCPSGLLEQRIETTFQVVSILIGYAYQSLFLGASYTIIFEAIDDEGPNHESWLSDLDQ
jgi:hypothetical protein